MATKIRLLRGLESNRTLVVPAVGEPLYTTDTHKLYMGDGVTPGGVLIVSNTDLSSYVTTTYLDSLKNTANGLAALDANGKLDINVLPALAITNTYVVTSQAEQDALTVQSGDVCIRIDLNDSFIYDGSAWQNIVKPNAVAVHETTYDHTKFLSQSDVNTANGVAPLDASSKVPLANLPDFSLKYYEVGSQTEQLALINPTVQLNVGDTVKRTDQDVVYLYAGQDRLNMSDFVPLNNTHDAPQISWIKFDVPVVNDTHVISIDDVEYKITVTTQSSAQEMATQFKSMIDAGEINITTSVDNGVLFIDGTLKRAYVKVKYYRLVPASGTSVYDFELGDTVGGTPIETYYPEFINTSTGGATGWVTSLTSSTGTGSMSASGADSASATTTITKTFQNPGIIEFDYRVSSESGFDYFNFKIDNDTLIHESGLQTGFTTISFPFTAGTHDFIFDYTKDGSAADGLDTVFIDNIKFFEKQDDYKHFINVDSYQKIKNYTTYYLEDSYGNTTYANRFIVPESVDTLNVVTDVLDENDVYIGLPIGRKTPLTVNLLSQSYDVRIYIEDDSSGNYTTFFNYSIKTLLDDFELNSNGDKREYIRLTASGETVTLQYTPTSNEYLITNSTNLGLTELYWQKGSHQLVSSESYPAFLSEPEYDMLFSSLSFPYVVEQMFWADNSNLNMQVSKLNIFYYKNYYTNTSITLPYSTNDGDFVAFYSKYTHTIKTNAQNLAEPGTTFITTSIPNYSSSKVTVFVFSVENNAWMGEEVNPLEFMSGLWAYKKSFGTTGTIDGGTITQI